MIRVLWNSRWKASLIFCGVELGSLSNDSDESWNYSYSPHLKKEDHQFPVSRLLFGLPWKYERSFFYDRLIKIDFYASTRCFESRILVASLPAVISDRGGGSASWILKIEMWTFHRKKEWEKRWEMGVVKAKLLADIV